MLNRICRTWHFLLFAFLSASHYAWSTDEPPSEPKVLVEEDVYQFVNPNNGSGPLWSFGCTPIARLGERVFVSQMETGEGVPPLSNTRWRLLERTGKGWEMVAEADGYRQREPCVLATTSKRDLFLYVNDSLMPPGTKYGACEPHLLRFDMGKLELRKTKLTPVWDDAPTFTDHSYRGFAADPARDELLMLNIDAKTGIQHWCLMNDRGKIFGNGNVEFPIRACYPQLALHKRAAHLLAIGDIVEPIKEWREYKFAQTQRTWDYVFRILYFTWSPDLTRQGFAAPIEIANVDATGGQISNRDLWVAPNGDAYVLYTEREVQSELLRDKFFPGKSTISSLYLAVVRRGAVIARHTLMAGTEQEQPGTSRFHVTPDGHVYALIHRGGPAAANYLMPIYPELKADALVKVPLKTPFSDFCLANTRAGNRPSEIIDVIGNSTAGDRMSYAQIELDR